MLRPVTVEDLETLAELDGAYAGEHGAPAVVSAGSVAFYARAGHAFVAERADAVVGGALAHADWDGRRPTVRLVRLMGAPGARAALLEAVVKSAYDAGVVDLVAEVPVADEALAALLADAWRERPVRRFERVLGSRAAGETA